MQFFEKIPSKIDNMPKLIATLLKKLEVVSFKEDEILDIRLCLEEAIINAIKHGNRMNPDLFVEVQMNVSDQELCIQIRNEGEGFDFKELPNPTIDKNLTKPSGRGVFLIKKLMDEVEFFDKGRGIKMVKFLNKEAGNEHKTGKTRR